MLPQLALGLLLRATAVEPIEVERVVAVVDREIITQSELVREARIGLALRGGPALATATLSQEVLAGMLEFLISRALVANQARRLDAPEASNEDVERAAGALRLRFASANAYRLFLHRYGITEAQVSDSLRAELYHRSALDERLRTRLLGQEGDTDSRYQAALRDWLRELRQSSEIRRVGADGRLELQIEER